MLRWTNMWKLLMDSTNNTFLEDIYIKMMHAWFSLWVINIFILSYITKRTNEKWHIKSVPYLESVSARFCDLMKVTKNTGPPLYLLLKTFFLWKNCTLRTIWSSSFNGKRIWKQSFCSESSKNSWKGLA